MELITKFFFPPQGEHILTFVAYAVLLFATYRRFNTLTEDYAALDAPETARPWTTWLRYHAAAAVYYCLFATLFAMLFNIFIRHPDLFRFAAKKLIPKLITEEEVTALLKDIKPQTDWMVPLASLLFLTLGVQKIRKFHNWDRSVRRRFQCLGSIPKQISVTIGQLEHYKLNMDMQELALGLSEAVKNEVMVPERQLNPNTLEHMLLRAVYLHAVISEWGDRRARFYDFFTVYQRQYGHIKSQFKKTTTALERYYRLKFEVEQAATARGAQSRAAESAAYRKSLTELRADVRHELKKLLDSLYTFIACAVHSEAISKKTRLNDLREIGFILPDKAKTTTPLLDPNDLAVLILFTVFVIPLTALLANYIGGGVLNGQALKIFAIWSPMAVVAGLSSVVFALAAKQCTEQSEHPFWQKIRSGQGRPWFCYILGGFFAGLGAIVGLTALGQLDPDIRGMGPVNILYRMAPWGLVALAMSIATAYQLDSRDTKGRYQRLLEGLVTASAALLGASVALFISRGSFSLDVFVKGFRFPLTAALLLGGSVGAILPARVRERLSNAFRLKLSIVDLNEILRSCLTSFEPQARSKQVLLSIAADNDLPHVEIDPARVEQALRGLVTNALEHTQEGGEIVVEAHPSPSGAIRLMVRDNGIGMDQDILQVAADASLRPNRIILGDLNGGSEANLSQIQAIASMHGGRFGIDSELRSGTEAWIEFPRSVTRKMPVPEQPQPTRVAMNHV